MTEKKVSITFTIDELLSLIDDIECIKVDVVRYQSETYFRLAELSEKLNNKPLESALIKGRAKPIGKKNV